MTELEKKKTSLDQYRAGWRDGTLNKSTGSNNADYNEGWNAGKFARVSADKYALERAKFTEAEIDELVLR